MNGGPSGGPSGGYGGGSGGGSGNGQGSVLEWYKLKPRKFTLLIRLLRDVSKNSSF